MRLVFGGGAREVGYTVCNTVGGRTQSAACASHARAMLRSPPLSFTCPTSRCLATSIFTMTHPCAEQEETKVER
jgi:hypothetical protein